MTADKGWPLDYVLGLTYRQVGCLYERYWDRKLWEIEIQAAMNPFAGEDKGADRDSLEEVFNLPAIDITEASGQAFLEQEMGIKVKRRSRKG